MNWKTIHTEQYTPQGEVLKTRLELEGITCRILNEYGNMMVYNTSGVEIQVVEQDVQQALELLVEWSVIPELPKQQTTIFDRVAKLFVGTAAQERLAKIPLINRIQSPVYRWLAIFTLILALVFMLVYLFERNEQKSVLEIAEYCVVDILHDDQRISTTSENITILYNDWCADRLKFVQGKQVVFDEYFNLPSAFEWYIINDQLLLENSVATEHPFCGLYAIEPNENWIDLTSESISIRIAPFSI